MCSVIVDVSDKLMESLAKMKAVADLIWIADNKNLSDDTLTNIGWFLTTELRSMEEQVDRLMPNPGN